MLFSTLFSTLFPLSHFLYPFVANLPLILRALSPVAGHRFPFPHGQTLLKTMFFEMKATYNSLFLAFHFFHFSSLPET